MEDPSIPAVESIEDLEAKLSTLEGDERARLRRRIRRLRLNRDGVSMSRVRRPRITSAYIADEPQKVSHERLRRELDVLGVVRQGKRSGPFRTTWWYPVGYPAEILVNKYVARMGRSPRAYILDGDLIALGD